MVGQYAKVAAAHYLQVRDRDFDRALARGAKSGALEAQDAAQQSDAGDGDESQISKESEQIIERNVVSLETIK